MPGLSLRFRGSVGRLLATMPAEEFAEWRTLYEIEPWADERQDLAAGEIVATTVAAHGGQPKAPRESMPYLKKPRPRRQSEAEMKATWAAVCAIREKMEQERLKHAKSG